MKIKDRQKQTTDELLALFEEIGRGHHRSILQINGETEPPIVVISKLLAKLTTGEASNTELKKAEGILHFYRGSLDFSEK